MQSIVPATQKPFRIWPIWKSFPAADQSSPVPGGAASPVPLGERSFLSPGCLPRRRPDLDCHSRCVGMADQDRTPTASEPGTLLEGSTNLMRIVPLVITRKCPRLEFPLVRAPAGVRFASDRGFPRQADGLPRG